MWLCTYDDVTMMHINKINICQHAIYCKYNNTLLYNLQLSINKETFNNSEANSTTSFSSNPPDQPATTILDNIELLKADIANLNKKIEDTKNQEITTIRNKVKELKSKSPQKNSFSNI